MVKRPWVAGTKGREWKFRNRPRIRMGERDSRWREGVGWERTAG